VLNSGDIDRWGVELSQALCRGGEVNPWSPDSLDLVSWFGDVWQFGAVEAGDSSTPNQPQNPNSSLNM